MFHYDLTVSNQEVFYGHYKACQAIPLKCSCSSIYTTACWK